MSYFTPNLIALSPPAPVLQYICNYLLDTPPANQIPLNQICLRLLNKDFWLC